MNKLFLFISLLFIGNTLNAQQPTIKLIGTTRSGSIFSTNADGTEVETITDFKTPYNHETHNRLIFAEGKLWGVTNKGAQLGGGTIYTIDPSSGEFTIVYEFRLGDYFDEPYSPVGGLTLSNDKLWGVAEVSNSSKIGGIYAIDTDGKNLVWHHYFKPSSYRVPSGRLVEYGGKLYGIASYNEGGVGNGAVFSIDTSGNNFTIVHDFDGPYDLDGTGRIPKGTLVVSNDRLWGTTFRGGREDQGVIFSIDLKTGAAKKISEFVDGNGSLPNGNLLEYEDQLWGLASDGGLGEGVIYKIDPVTESVQVVHKFFGTDGRTPVGGLTAHNGRLWGITKSNIESHQTNYVPIARGGIIFSFDPNNPGDIRTEYEFENQTGSSPDGSLYVHNNQLWGTTDKGAYADEGGIYHFDPNTTIYTEAHRFGPVASSSSEVLQVGNKLYGLGRAGGAYPYGSIFSVSLDGKQAKLLHLFDEENGSHPVGKLVLANNELWGVTQQGGAEHAGVIFRIDTSAANYTVVHHFSPDTEGSYSESGLVLLNGKLWGTTQESGTGNSNVQHWGTIFAIDTTGANFETVYRFDRFTGHGPDGPLTVYDGKLWGVTQFGGNTFDEDSNLGQGVIFRIDSSGSNFLVVHNFEFQFLRPLTTGVHPYGGLTVSNEKLWGSTLDGGDGNGVAFTIDTTGANYHEFNVFDLEENPPFSAGNLLEYEGKLYGVTLKGGAEYVSQGTIFTLDTATHERSVIHTFLYNTHNNPYGKLVPMLVQKGTPRISFDPIPDQVYGNAPFKIAATSSTTNNPIRFVTSDESIATVLDNEVTIMGAGTVTINAEQADDKNYFPANAAQTFTVLKAGLTVTVVDTNKAYGEKNPDFILLYDGFVNGDSVSALDIAPRTSSLANRDSNPGTYTIVASEGQDKNYSFSYNSGVLTITEFVDTTRTLTAVNEIDIPLPYAYPNPVSSGQELTVHLGTTYDRVQIQITTLSGRKVLSQEYQHISQIQTMSDIPSGFYILRITTDQNPPVSYKICKH